VETMLSLAAGLLRSARAAGMHATLRLDRQETFRVDDGRSLQRALDALALWPPEMSGVEHDMFHVKHSEPAMPAAFVLPSSATRFEAPRCVWAIVCLDTFEHLSAAQRQRPDVRFLVVDEAEAAGNDDARLRPRLDAIAAGADASPGVRPACTFRADSQAANVWHVARVPVGTVNLQA